MTRTTDPSRRAFTVMECTLALALILLVALIVAQCLVWSLRERAKAAAQQVALELATNVLEEARALGFDKLDPTWAAGRTIPSEVEAMLPEGKLSVLLEPGPSPGLTKRITVEVRWVFEPNIVAHSVSLTTLVSARETKKTGEKP